MPPRARVNAATRRRPKSTTRPLVLHPDRRFPAEPTARRIARALHASVAGLPIVSPHGHTDPAWFALNAPFGNAADLLLRPDHYLLRMLYSQGIALAALGIGGAAADRIADPRASWRLLAQNYPPFRGTPSRLWHDWVFAEVFGLTLRLEAETADLYYETITEALAGDGFRPRALFDRFGIELIATTESPLDSLAHHQAIRAENASSIVAKPGSSPAAGAPRSCSPNAR